MPRPCVSQPCVSRPRVDFCPLHDWRTSLFSDRTSPRREPFRIFTSSAVGVLCTITHSITLTAPENDRNIDREPPLVLVSGVSGRVYRVPSRSRG